MNALKFLTLIFLPVNDNDANAEKMINIGTIVFFSVFVLLMVVCFALLVIAYNNEYFITVLERVGQVGNSKAPSILEKIPEIPERDYLIPKGGADDTARFNFHPQSLIRWS